MTGVLPPPAPAADADALATSVGSLAVELSRAASVDEVARGVLRTLLRSWSADYAAYLVQAPGGDGWRGARRLAVEQEADDGFRPSWVHFERGAGLPGTDVAERGSALFLDAAAVRQAYPSAPQDTSDEGLAAVAVLPWACDGVSGSFLLGFLEPHAWAPGQQRLLAAAAELVGQVSARAKRYDAQRGTAELLQRRLLPAHLPSSDALLVAASYVPGTVGTSVGGDFYDSFVLRDGRTALVLGDVMGRGVEAATVMGQVRAGLRALALAEETIGPDVVLEAADHLVTSVTGGEVFVTALVGVLDARTGVLDLADAGHLRPLLRSADGTVAAVRVVAGPPLGVPGARPPVRVVLAPGDTLVIFTDGLVERRGEDIGLGLARAAQVLRELRPPLHGRALCASLVARLAPTSEDDVAVLAVTRRDGLTRSASLHHAGGMLAPGAARRWLGATLTEWAVASEVAEHAVLCLSELVANAVVHAGTSVAVAAEVYQGRLTLAVQDAGADGAPTVHPHDLESTRGRGLELVGLLADAWGVERSSAGSTVWFELDLAIGSP